MNVIYNKVILSLLLVLSMFVGTYAVENFSITADSLTKTVELNNNVSFSVTVENTGNETLNLTINSLQLVDGGNIISFDSSSSSITSLNESQSVVIQFTSQSVVSNLGTYTGTLNIENSNNASMSETLSLQANVVDSRSLQNPTITTPNDARVGEDVTIGISVQNNGTVIVDSANVVVSIPSLSLSQTYTLTSLGAGSSDTENVVFSIPSATAFGERDVNVTITYADSAKTVSSTRTFFIFPTQSVYFDGFSQTVDFEIELDETDSDERIRLVNGFDVEISDIIFDLQSDIGDFEVETHIEFEESRDRELDVDDEENEEFTLAPGASYSIVLVFDNLDEIPIDSYFQSNALEVRYQVNGISQSELFNIRIDADKDDVEIQFRQSEFEFEVERGDDVDFDLQIVNDEEFDVDNVTIKIGDEFELVRDSSEELSDSQFTFERESAFRVDEGTEDFEIEFESNDNDEIGTYEGTFVIEYNGDEIDEISITVKIVDGVFVQSVNPRTDAIPDQTLRVDVQISNEDNTQSIIVTGRMNNVNSFGTDLVDSETIVIAKGNEETVTLSFDIPDDVRSNDLLLEVTVDYENPEDRDERVEFVEEVDINVNRPESEISVESSFASPNIAICSDTIQSKVTFKNVGSNDESGTVSARVVGTSLSSNTQNFDLNENEQDEFTYLVPISSLSPGTYNIEFTFLYSGSTETEIVSFEKRECNADGNTGGVIPLPNSNSNTSTSNGGQVVLSGSTGGSTTDNTVDSQDSSFFTDLGIDTTTLILLSVFALLFIITIVVVIVVLL